MDVSTDKLAISYGTSKLEIKLKKKTQARTNSSLKLTSERTTSMSVLEDLEVRKQINRPACNPPDSCPLRVHEAKHNKTTMPDCASLTNHVNAFKHTVLNTNEY